MNKSTYNVRATKKGSDFFRRDQYEEKRTARAVSLEFALFARLKRYVVPVSDGLVERLALRHLKQRYIGIKKYFMIQNGSQLLDKLGVDLLVEINGVRMALDVTTGKHGLIQEKAVKLNSLRPFLEELGGFTPVILRCLNDRLPADLEMQLLDNIANGDFKVNQVNTLKIRADNHVFCAKERMQ